jgi:hypothetical protein
MSTGSSKRKTEENQISFKRILNETQIYKNVKRTLSNPIMLLNGHLGPVTSCQFSNSGGI